MDMPSRSDADSSNELPKDNTQDLASSTPPPAYTPPRRLDITALAAMEIQQTQGDVRMQLNRQLWTTLLSGTADEESESESSEGISPISLRINTSVNVSKSNNLVCLTATPADHANAIAHAVVQAIQKHSSGQCGIPMIDEDGRPRPVKIEVDAGMVIEGSGNVIGGPDIIAEVLRERSLRRRQREEDDDDDDGCSAEGSEAAAKRRRSSQ